jgi:hypothetical protein
MAHTSMPYRVVTADASTPASGGVQMFGSTLARCEGYERVWTLHGRTAERGNERSEPLAQAVALPIVRFRGGVSSVAYGLCMDWVERALPYSSCNLT